MTVKGSERPPEKTCNTEGCNAWATKESGRKRCDNCGGKSTGPKTEEGKKKSRMNGLDTGLRADPENLFDEIAERDPEKLEYIFFKLHEYAEDSPKEVFEVDVTDADSFEEAQESLTGHGDELLRLSVMDYARWRGTTKLVKEGFTKMQTRSGEHGTFEVEDANPVNLELDRSERTGLKKKNKFSLLPSPEKEKSSSMRSLAEVLSED